MQKFLEVESDAFTQNKNVSLGAAVLFANLNILLRSQALQSKQQAWPVGPRPILTGLMMHSLEHALLTWVTHKQYGSWNLRNMCSSLYEGF